MPTTTQITIDAINKGKEINKGKLASLEKIVSVVKTMIKPMTPPIIQSKTASIKNSKSILLRLAPMAFF